VERREDRTGHHLTDTRLDLDAAARGRHAYKVAYGNVISGGVSGGQLDPGVRSSGSCPIHGRRRSGSTRDHLKGHSTPSTTFPPIRWRSKRLLSSGLQGNGSPTQPLHPGPAHPHRAAHRPARQSGEDQQARRRALLDLTTHGRVPPPRCCHQDRRHLSRRAGSRQPRLNQGAQRGSRPFDRCHARTLPAESGVPAHRAGRTPPRRRPLRAGTTMMNQTRGPHGVEDMVGTARWVQRTSGRLTTADGATFYTTEVGEKPPGAAATRVPEGRHRCLRRESVPPSKLGQEWTAAGQDRARPPAEPEGLNTRPRDLRVRGAESRRRKCSE